MALPRFSNFLQGGINGLVGLGAKNGLKVSENAYKAAQSLGPMLSSAAKGAIVGGGIAGLYNMAADDNVSIGKGMAIGAMGLGALRAGRYFAKNPIKFGSALKGNNNIKGSIGSWISNSGDSFAGKINKFLNKGASESIDKLTSAARLSKGSKSSATIKRSDAAINRWARSKVLNANKNYSSILGSAVPGAMIGAGAGAAYGMFSDRESMMSGAFKGALGGAIASAGYRAYKGGFTHVGSNSPINKIESAASKLTSKSPYRAPSKRGLAGRGRR